MLRAGDDDGIWRGIERGLLVKAIQEGVGANGYAARAQAQLRLGRYLEAAEDAGKAIELDDKMAKAYLRKA